MWPSWSIPIMPPNTPVRAIPHIFSCLEDIRGWQSMHIWAFLCPRRVRIVSQDHYATKLKKRFQFAYKVASKEAQKAADRNNANYDLKIRETTLGVGDRVLIRQVAFKGRHKISYKWDMSL